MTTSVRCVGRHDRPAWATIGLLCTTCRQRLHRDIIRLPALAEWLAVNLAPGRGVTEKISGSRALPVPVRLDVLDLIGPATELPVSGTDQVGLPSIHATVTTWCRIVHAERHGEPPVTVELSVLCGWLGAQVGWLAEQPWVSELSEQMSSLHHFARLVAPWEAERRMLPTPCPVCDVKALVFYGGENRITCVRTVGGCGHDMDDHDYKRLVTEALTLGRAST